MRNSELNRSQEYRILVNVKLKNPPIGEDFNNFIMELEKIKDTVAIWETLSDEEKACGFKGTPTKLFIKWFNRYFGRVDYPPDLRDDRPTATFLPIKNEDLDRDIILEYDPSGSYDGDFAYLVTPVISMKDFEEIIEHILLPSKIFQLSGVLSLIRQHLPPDTRSWITDGKNKRI